MVPSQARRHTNITAAAYYKITRMLDNPDKFDVIYPSGILVALPLVDLPQELQVCYVDTVQRAGYCQDIGSAMQPLIICLQHDV